MTENNTEKDQTIFIKQEEALEATSILAHLRQIFSTVTLESGNGQLIFSKVVDMDQAELLRCSASIRTLFFDPTSPLTAFLKRHSLNVEFETVETDLNLLFLTMLYREGLHPVDFIMAILLDTKTRDGFPLDKNNQVPMFYNDRAGFEEIMEDIDLWMPSKEKREEKNLGVGINTQNFTPSQFINITRRKVQLSDWGKVRIGYLKDISIDRKALIEYVANWLGGVHYNSKRFAKNKNDKEKFEVLATVFDWDNQSFMHAGLVMTALACIEILNSPIIMKLYFSLEEFQHKRIERLARGEKLTA